MSRASSVIFCPVCEWSAKHTADTPQEVIEFLAKLFTQHNVERHVKEKR